MDIRREALIGFAFWGRAAVQRRIMRCPMLEIAKRETPIAAEAVRITEGELESGRCYSYSISDWYGKIQPYIKS